MHNAPEIDDTYFGYKLLAQLGVGAFGIVFEGGNTIEGKEPSKVAIKFVSRKPHGSNDITAIEHYQRLLDNEIRSLEKFTGEHPSSIIHVHEIRQEPEDYIAIIMERADTSLEQWIRENAAMDEVARKEICNRWMRQLAEGFDFLADQYIAHYDVKPANILIARSEVKIADFGLSKEFNQSIASGTMVGTPAYMSPEMWGGEQGSRYSDLYSLALTYCMMRKGTFPYTVETDPVSPGVKQYQLMLAHLDEHRNLSGYEEHEQRTLRKALSKNPRDRFGSCREFVDELCRDPQQFQAPLPEDCVADPSRVELAAPGESTPSETPTVDNQPNATPAGNVQAESSPPTPSQPASPTLGTPRQRNFCRTRYGITIAMVGFLGVVVLFAWALSFFNTDKPAMAGNPEIEELKKEVALLKTSLATQKQIDKINERITEETQDKGNRDKAIAAANDAIKQADKDFRERLIKIAGDQSNPTNPDGDFKRLVDRYHQDQINLGVELLRFSEIAGVKGDKDKPGKPGAFKELLDKQSAESDVLKAGLDYPKMFALAMQYYTTNQYKKAIQVLDMCPMHERQFEWDFLRYHCDADRQGKMDPIQTFRKPLYEKTFDERIQDCIFTTNDKRLAYVQKNFISTAVLDQGKINEDSLITKQESEITRIGYSKANDRIIVGCKNGYVGVVLASKQKRDEYAYNSETSPVISITSSDDGKKCFVAWQNGKMKILNLNDDKELKDMDIERRQFDRGLDPVPAYTLDGIYPAAMSSNMKACIFLNSAGQTGFWQEEGGGMVKHRIEDKIFRYAIDYEGQVMAILGGSNSITTVVSDGNELVRIDHLKSSNGIVLCEFSPKRGDVPRLSKQHHGLRFATCGSYGGAVEIWHVETGAKLLSLKLDLEDREDGAHIHPKSIHFDTTGTKIVVSGFMHGGKTKEKGFVWIWGSSLPEVK